jgi:hypothetical protein
MLKIVARMIVLVVQALAVIAAVYFGVLIFWALFY